MQTHVSDKHVKITLLCPEQDSNLHTSRHTHLKRTRLPIPPPGLRRNALVAMVGATRQQATAIPPLKIAKTSFHDFAFFQRTALVAMVGATRQQATAIPPLKIAKTSFYDFAFFQRTALVAMADAAHQRATAIPP